ncbi:GNAT family N-acetyltransferase [Robertkochia flava]|uniref:GNAT family N-acetyltransferase n=1 Tax=Robertkochia flava TaxID=3447986 RepID=UPI001CCD0FE0|nr:GNAT family N-acetyltransferase [Robertkochia marina]
MQIRQACTREDLDGILQLQQENHKDHLSPSEMTTEGFLTVKHTPELLEEMNRELKHIIAVVNKKVVGYALCMTPNLRNRLPVLESMFEKLDGLSFEGSALKDSAYYIMGQICVDKYYRGTGVFTKLYEGHRKFYSGRYDHIITEVSEGNPRSLRAHEKTGFQTLLRYRDTTDNWHLILWNWNS